MTPDAIQTAVEGLLRRQARGVEDRLRRMLEERGIDPDDRSEGWEDRARAALGDLEIVERTDWSDPYRLTLTTEIRPRRPRACSCPKCERKAEDTS